MAKKAQKHTYGSRTLWTALAIVIVIIVAAVIVLQNRSQASYGDSGYVNDPNFPFSSQNTPTVTTQILGAIKMAASQTDADLTGTRLKLYKVNENGKLVGAGDNLEDAFKPSTDPVRGLAGNNRQFTHAASLKKGEVYRIVLFNVGNDTKKRAQACSYVDFQVPWVYTAPILSLTVSAEALGNGSSLFPGSKIPTTIQPIDLNCSQNPPAITREAKPAYTNFTITGQLGKATLSYPPYVISNASTSIDTYRYIYINSKDPRIAADATASVRKTLDCFISNKGWAQTSNPQFTFNGRFKVATKAEGYNTKAYIISTVTTSDLILSKKCATPLTNPTPDDDIVDES